jgi:hypothetical protein
MTWIKPPFLWMMYRSGWGLKDSGQAKILAIDIRRDGFEWALKNSCLSHKPLNLNKEEWSNLKAVTPVRIQWDPERNIHLEALSYRSIQIGLSGLAVDKYINEWITAVTDITEYATNIRMALVNGNNTEALDMLPKEKSLEVPCKHIFA